MAKYNEHGTFFEKLKSAVVGRIERFFYNYGLLIARHPYKFIFGCLVLALLSGIGFLRFRQEKNPLKLWVPPDSDFMHDTEWIINTFKEGNRNQYAIITAPNVLEPSVLLEVERMRKKVVSFSSNNVTYEDVCFRIPAVKPGSIGIADVLNWRKKRSFFFFGHDDEAQMGSNTFDPSLLLSSGTYCKIVNKLERVCIEMNLPQLWENDEDQLRSLSLEDVIEKLNTTRVSPVTGHSITFPALLGGITRDDTGKIIAARSLISVWMTHVNFSMVDMDETGNSAGTSFWATAPVLEWESGFIDLLENETNALLGSNISLYYEGGRSYGDISSKSIFQDMDKLSVGIVLMFVFVQLVLPKKFTKVEMKFWLGCVGLICVLISYVIAVGVCSLLGIPYGPVHTSLPFLMLGIGVDDMFVITSCWHNLHPTEKQTSTDKQIALTLKHASLSITITTVTDCIAFLIGSYTILPCLQSFCIYTAVGIAVMYFFQSTFYVAFLSLDARRMVQKRNCVFWWIRHDDLPEVETVETAQSKIIGKIYEKVILRPPFKIFTIFFTICMLVIAIKGNLNLQQRFEPEWFLPEDSYLMKFISHRKAFYPDLGKDGALFIGKGNYNENFLKIHNLSITFTEQDRILKVVDSWTTGFIKYTKLSSQIDLLSANVTDETFQQLLGTYLWSPKGARFQKNFKFSENFTCGNPVPPIEISTIDFIFMPFSGPEEYLPAMNRLKALVKEAQLPRASVWAIAFGNWVTDEVIDRELYRNLGMALGCVMLCTALLIIDVQICFWIFICVLFTLVDVAGFMYFWGLYIDIVSCIALVLAVGLCVDFAAHIGHTFLRLTGTRQERALNTVKYIGVATINGALSTLLAISILGFSSAYLFSTFFKIFLLVILFGVFHGVVFLPVVLSIIGPSSYHGVTKKSTSKELKVFKITDYPEEETKLSEDLNENLEKSTG